MDDAILQKVCTLAGALRQSAHLLLSRQHKLSLDTWSLCEIQEAFSLILEVEQHTNFHVLPANHRQHPAIPHLQFIYDLLQKIYGLRLWARHGVVLPPDQVVSLRCLRSLQALELDHTPVSCLKGLQNLRPNLKSISAVKCIHQLSDLFIRCGADKAGEFAWQQLEIAILSHNNLTTLDQSLRLLPNLQVLDLSHCCLEDGSALEFLPRVTYLDLSHNHLTILPRLSPTAAKTLTVILVNNNLISHIGGLEECQGLEEVDLRDNVLSLQEVLTPLSLLPQLKTLALKGNPLACDQNYRMHTVKRLNPQITNHKVVLDCLPLSSVEVSLLGSCVGHNSSNYPPQLLLELSSVLSPIHPALRTASGSQPASLLTHNEIIDADTSQPASMTEESISGSVKSNGNLKKKSRKSHIRHITIEDSADEEEEDSDGIQAIPESDGGIQVHPEERDEIQALPEMTYSESSLQLNTNLLGQSDLLVAEVGPSTPPPSLAVGTNFKSFSNDSLAEALNVLQIKDESKSTELEQSDKLLEEILQDGNTSFVSERRVSVTVQEDLEDENTVLDQPTHLLPGDRIDATSSSKESTSSISFSPAKSLEAVGSLESSFYKAANESESRQSSVSPVQTDSEEENEEEIHRFLAHREIDNTDRRTHFLNSQDSNSSDADATLDSSCAEGKKLMDVILAVTKEHFKEKHHITTRTLYRWELDIIESLEVLSSVPYKVLLTFSTIRPAYKSRTYVLDESDYQGLVNVLNPVLERNTLSEVLHSTMKCLKCSTQFSKYNATQHQGGGGLRCPNCGGGIVVQTENIDHPSVLTMDVMENIGPRSSTPLTDINSQNHLHQQIVDTAERQQSVEVNSSVGPGEWSESVSVCSETSSSIRRESDVEVISNPSVSSIEVLNDQPLLYDAIVEEDETWRAPVSAVFNIDARTPTETSPPADRPKAESNTHMQESSSSGSMSGSVCTTYEKTSAPPTPIKVQPTTEEEEESDMSIAYQTCMESSDLRVLTEVSGTSPHSFSSATSIDTLKNVGSGSAGGLSSNMHHVAVMTSQQPILSEDSTDFPEQQKSLAAWVHSLLHTLTGYYWPWWDEVEDIEGLERTVNPIQYSYEDFKDVDHRLKLYCEVLLFHEPGEYLHGLIKAVILVRGGRREFQGLLVLSNMKLYVLEIVAPEDESPASWLEVVSSHELAEVTTIHSLLHRQGLAITAGDFLLLLSLADSHRANCAYNFITEMLEESGIGCGVDECSQKQEAALLLALKESLPTAAQEHTLNVFAVVSLLLDGGCSESQFLAMTDNDLVLYQADLTWYLPPTPHTTLQLNHCQKIANIVAIEIYSDSHISISFVDEVSGSESQWELHVTSSVAACHIIQAIRTPWTQLFTVELQVTYRNNKFNNQDLIGVYKTSEGSVLRVTQLSEESSVDDTLTDEKQDLKATTTLSGQWCNVAAIAAPDPEPEPEPESYPVLGYSELRPLNILEQEYHGTGISKGLKDSAILEYGNDGNEDLEGMNKVNFLKETDNDKQFYQTEHTGLVIDHVASSLISQNVSDDKDKLCCDNKLQGDKHKEIYPSDFRNKDFTIEVLNSNPTDPSSAVSFMNIEEKSQGKDSERERHQTCSTKEKPRRRRSGLAAVNISTLELNKGILERKLIENTHCSVEKELTIEDSVKVLDFYEGSEQLLKKTEIEGKEDYTVQNIFKSESIGIENSKTKTEDLINFPEEECDMNAAAITNWTVGEPLPTYPLFEEGNTSQANSNNH